MSKEVLSYEEKLCLAKSNVIEFYEQLDGKVYIAFSGGRDSTVLLHIVRKIYPNVVAVFNDTGLEYPEIKDFVRKTDNVIWLKPKMSFKDVIEKYGYPVISKENAQKIEEIRTTKSEKLLKRRLGNGNGHLPKKWRFLIEAPFKISDKCCKKLKKEPAKKFERESGLSPMLGIRKKESALRNNRQGCNMFCGKRPTSWPLGSWSEDDINRYIKENNVEISNIYDMGYKRTGCMFCMFGCHLEKEDRFARMRETHPKIFEYCMEHLKLKDVLSFIKARGKTQ